MATLSAVVHRWGSGRTGRACHAGLLVAVTACLALATSVGEANGSPHPTCQSGQTLFSRGAVRAFKVSGPADQEAFVCSGPSSTPVAIDDPGPATEVIVGNFHIRGTRLGFEYEDVGLGAGGSDTGIGWVDLRSGEVRIGLLNAGQGASKSEPRLPPAEVGYAFAPDGTTAVIAGTACEVVAVLPVRATPDEGGYTLGFPVVVFTARHGGLYHWSVAITQTAVTWETVDGARHSAALPAAGARTGSPTGGC